MPGMVSVAAYGTPLACRSTAITFSPIIPTLRTATRQSVVSAMSEASARSTDTWSRTSATLCTFPFRKPFTCTSSLVLRPPVWGNVTCQTRTRRASESCLSQVTPHNVMPSASSTVTPTWISLVRLNLAPSWLRGGNGISRSLHRCDRTLAAALDELAHEHVARDLRLGRRAGELHPALVQQRHAVAHLPRAVQVVRHHDRRHVHALLDRADEVVDDVGHDRIQAGRRLVVEDIGRIDGHRAREANALLHAARERGGLHVLDALEPDPGQPLGDATMDLVIADPQVLAHRQRDVLADGERIEQRSALEQHAEAPAHAVQLGLVQVCDVLAVHDDAALVRVHEADDVLQEHALPAAAAAQDHGREAGRQLEEEVLEHLLRAE